MKVQTLRKPLLLTALLLTAFSGNAQTKRPTTTTRPRTTTATRPRTTTSTRPTQQKPTEKRWGCYELRASHIAPTDSVIYYLEGEENNALMALDCQTGAVRTVIPGIKGVYEGGRPLFRDVVATGGKLLLQVDNPKRGVYIWEGNSLSTSKKLDGVREMSSYNGKYVLVYANAKNGGDFDTGDFLLWDLEQMKCLLRYPSLNADYEYTIYHELDKAVMDTAATLWKPTSMGVWRIPRKGKDVKYQLTGEYINMLREEGTLNQYEEIKQQQLSLQGDYLYVAFHRRIYRMNVYAPGTWEEYARMPATEKGDFSQVGVLSDGSLLTHVSVDYDYTTLYFPVGQFDAPVKIGRRPSLPTTGHFLNMDRECWFSLNYMQYDRLGNILVLTNSKDHPAPGSLDTGDLWVLNPLGIQGYKNAVGKVLEQKD
ncbi:MAG: hypothetical protein IJ064_07300 [Bacteroidaceae bacterium]|nr:hypothetical protein [Bacteroidaceae bacterium]